MNPFLSNIIPFPSSSIELEEHVARVSTIKEQAWRSHMLIWKLERRINVLEDYLECRDFEFSDWMGDLTAAIPKMKEELADLRAKHRDILAELPVRDRDQYEVDQ